MLHILLIKLNKGKNMIQKMQYDRNLPPAVSASLARLGDSIKTARKRRRINMQEMASRMFVSRKTLHRLERGDPGVSIGTLASALWLLGLDKDLLQIADPEHDKIGIYRERQNLPQRVRAPSPEDDLDF
jgi:transcriptional regulator with XRE-family HTH domain